MSEKFIILVLAFAVGALVADFVEVKTGLWE